MESNKRTKINILIVDDNIANIDALKSIINLVKLDDFDLVI